MDIAYSIRLQIAALCIITVVIIDFFQTDKIRLVSSRWFSFMLIVGELFVLLDISTVMTLVHCQYSILNTIAHKAFFLMMLTFVSSFAVYIEIITNVRSHISKTRFFQLLSIPYIISVIGILFAKVEYVVDERGVYSKGPATWFLYFGLVFYTLFIYGETFRHRKVLGRKKQQAFRIHLYMWLVTMLIQRTNPYILLGGFIASLCIVILYFSYENPADNMDDETEVYNRKGFEKFFNQECKGNIRRTYKLIALCIDDFEVLASSIGRKRCKEVLITVAGYMKRNVDKDVYRISNNSFAVLLAADSSDIEGRLRALEDYMNDSIDIAGGTITIKSHVSLADCPTAIKDVESIDGMLGLVNERATGFVRVIDDEILSRVNRNDTLNRMLSLALANNGFEVYFQPIYDVARKKFSSAEALVRLKDRDTLGFVSPEEFIPVAEKNGYIGKLGEMVFISVCDTINKMQKEGIPISYMEVNLSALQIIDSNIAARYRAIMDDKTINPHMINFEITETTAVESELLLKNNVSLFRKIGCTFSIDDFGTGYSNLAKMVDLTYEIVKLDKSLIWPCFDNVRTGQKASEKSMAILKSVVSMLLSLGVKIVAEGVETREMAEELSKMGVHYLQGYYYSRPVPEMDYFKYVSGHQH